MDATRRLGSGSRARGGPARNGRRVYRRHVPARRPALPRRAHCLEGCLPLTLGGPGAPVTRRRLVPLRRCRYRVAALAAVTGLLAQTCAAAALQNRRSYFPCTYVANYTVGAQCRNRPALPMKSASLAAANENHS